MCICNLKINNQEIPEKCTANAIDSIGRGVYIKITDFNPLCAKATTTTKPLMKIYSVDGECIESYGISNKQINFDTLDNEFVNSASRGMNALNQVNLNNDAYMMGAVELRPTLRPAIGTIYDNGYVFIDGRSLEYNRDYTMYIWYTVKSNPLSTDSLKFAINSAAITESIPIAPIDEKTLARISFRFNQTASVPYRKCLTMFVNGCNVDVHGIVFVDNKKQMQTTETSIDGKADLPAFKNGTTYIVQDPSVITDIYYTVDSNDEIRKIYNEINSNRAEAERLNAVIQSLITDLSNLPHFTTRAFSPKLENGTALPEIANAKYCILDLELYNNNVQKKQFKSGLGVVNISSTGDYALTADFGVTVDGNTLYTAIINQDDYYVTNQTFTNTADFPNYIDLYITNILFIGV